MDVLRLTLRQLQIFVAVARSGSTVSASQALALSQSATSAALNELERLLSLQLFDRAGKRLLINENGRAMLPRALAMLEGAAGIEQLARTSAEQLLMLRIGASTTIGNYVLPGLLAGMYGAAGAVCAVSWHARVAIANTAAIGREIANLALDIGLVEGPVHEPDVESTPWLRDEMVIVCAAGNRAATGRVPVRVLRDAPWLLREPGSGTREAADQALLPHLRTYRRSLELGSSEAIKHAAAQGLGLCLLSRWVVEDYLQSGRLCIVQTTLPPVHRPCYSIRRRDKPLTPAMTALLAHLRPPITNPGPAHHSPRP